MAGDEAQGTGAGSGHLTRRALLGAGGAALLGACSAPVLGGDAAGTTGTAATAGTSGAPSATGTPGSVGQSSGHSPHWVRDENAKPGTRGWQVSRARRAAETDLAGYTDRVSVLPDADFGLHLSSALGPVTVRAFRIGHYGGVGARQVWVSEPVSAGHHAVPAADSAGTVRCRWPEALRVSTQGWPEGSYLLRLEAEGRQRYVPITVRSESTRDRLVLVSAVTCQQAYNTWGGHSLYEGPDGTLATKASVVSFDRPYDKDGAPVVLAYELGPVRLAESLDLDLAYVTSVEVHADPSLLDGAAGVVSLGHDEYWTVPMRRHVEAARDAGTNVAFLGANALYWRVRLDDDGRTMTCHKSAEGDPRAGRRDTTAMWRQQPHPDPEHTLVGMLYEAFPAQADLVVHDPDFFLFTGTGARRGSTYSGLVAIEIDRAYPIAGTPPNLQVVAHSPVPLFQRPDTHSDMTYYTAPSGAGVFAVGTMGWAAALRGPGARRFIDRPASDFARAVTRNLLREMADGPMGRRHPAHGNLAGLGASPRTSTGTGGPVASP